MSKDKDMLDVMSGLKSLREVAEKASGESAESKAAIAKIGEETSAALAKVQAENLAIVADSKKHQSEIDAVKKDFEELYKKSVRLGSAGGLDAAVAYDKYKAELSRYIRKGVTPSSEALNEIASEFVKKTIDGNDEHAVKNAVYNMLAEQGAEDGKGFYIIPELKNSLVTGSNPDGGYTVLPDRRSDISVTRIFETSPMRAVSQIITTGTNEVESIIDDNESMSGGWVGEATAPSQTNIAQVGLLKIPVHEQYAQPQVTQKMLDDSYFNVEAWLAAKTNDKLTRTENTAFVAGDGANKPKGFLSYAAWASAGVYERNKLEQVNSGTSGVFTADGLRRMQGRLLGAYQAGASFLTKRDSFTEISLLKDGAGRYLLNERMMADGVDVRLLGKPLYFADDMQAIAADALAIAYGDFGTAYTIVDRMGLRVLRDPYTAKPFIKFYTTKRVGGAVTNYQAIKIQKLAA